MGLTHDTEREPTPPGILSCAALKTDCERILTRLDARIGSDKVTRAANAKARLNGVLLTVASALVLLALLFLLLCQLQVCTSDVNPTPTLPLPYSNP